MTRATAIGGVVLIGAGGVNALVPTTLLLSASDILPASESGVLAIGLSVAGYASQLGTAWSLESRMTTAITGRLRAPRWAVVLGLLGCATLLASRGGWPALVGIVAALSALEITRAAAVSERMVAQETLAAAILASAQVIVLTADSVRVVCVVLGAGLGLVIAIRAAVSWTQSLGAPRGRGWVVGEAAVTGISQPVVTALVFALVGPVGAVSLRLAISVSGLLSPILGFLRLRLLREDSRSDVLLAAVLAVISAAGLLALVSLPVTMEYLRDSDVGLTSPALAAAVLWRLASLVSTPGFARLRRAGRAGTVFGLRVVFTAVYLVAGVSGALLGGVVGVLCGFLLAELLAATAYWRAES